MATPANQSIEPNMSVAPNMSTPNMSLANQTVASPADFAGGMSMEGNMTKMQPNMSTPQGVRYASPPVPKAPSAPTPSGTNVSSETGTVKVAGAGQQFSEGEQKIRDAVEASKRASEEMFAQQQAQSVEKAQQKTAPATAETTSKVNPDGSTTTETKDYTTPEAQQYKKHLDDSMASIDTEIQYAKSKFEGLMVGADAAQAALMESIQKTFEVRKYEMERTNKAALNTQQLLGSRSGRQRYAPEIQSSILSAEERAGLVRITEIEALELQTIAAAQQAATEEDYMLLNGLLSTMQGLRGEKNDIMQNMYDVAVKEEQRAQVRAKFVLDMQQYENEIVRYEMENEMAYASTVASSLVEFDDFMNVTMPTQQQIVEEAARIGIDPNILSNAVFEQIQTLQQMGADEYGTYFENQQFAAQQAQRDFDNFMSQQKFALEQSIFGLEAADKGFIFDESGQLISIATNEVAGVEDWAKQISNGILKMSDVPSDMRSAVASALNTLPPDPKDVLRLEQKVAEIDALLDHEGLNNAVGPNALARSAQTTVGAALRGGVIGLSGRTQARSFVGKVNSLLGEEVLNQLISAKANGATFGALSEGELAILQVAASPIRQYGVDADGDGMIDYFDIDEATFKEELGKIKENYVQLLDDGKKQLQGTPFTSFQDFNSRAGQYEKELYKQFDNDPAFQNATTEQIIEAINQVRSFNQPLSMGVKGSNVSGIKDGAKVITSIGPGTATGIVDGSPVWKYGFDFVLEGGLGAPVRVPFSGKVVSAGNAGGFGKSVLIELNDGRKIRASHLQNIKVKPGDRVNQNTILGGQGNTGTTLGPTGIHVDYTMYKPDGGYYTSQEVASFFNTKAIA